MSDCQACKNPGLMRKEPTPKAVKSSDCPYIKKCEEPVIKDEFELLCKDKEVGPNQTKAQAQMVHQAGHHCWEMCKVYLKNKVDEMEHRKPRDW